MSNMLVLNGRRILRGLFIIIVVAIVLYLAWSYFTADQPTLGSAEEVKSFDMMVVEYEGKHPETGEEIEVYRFHPGFLVVNQGDRVRLNITGLHGDQHPFMIEGLSVRGEVVKGKVSTVEFEATKKGTYRIVCLTHADHHSGGPMVAYLMVQ